MAVRWVGAGQGVGEKGKICILLLPSLRNESRLGIAVLFLSVTLLY